MDAGRARPDAAYKDFVLDQLEGLGELRAQSMFGGWGIYCDDAFFAIVFRSRLYFKTDNSTRQAYIAEGMAPFKPNADQMLQTYYEVPADVLEDPSLLHEWARAACTARSR